MSMNDQTCRFRFQGLPGFFFNLSEEQARQKSLIPAITLPGLGLIDRLYDVGHANSLEISQGSGRKPWQRFRDYLALLNSQDPSVSYKVLYITRHGYGHHNEVMAKVGRDAWNNHWSHLDGDGQITWADSHLNEKGIQQVNSLQRFWLDAVKNDMIPLPDTIYTSPLARTLETTRITFQKVMEENGKVFKPIIKELLRERLTDHTCDRRRTLSWIKEHYPDYIIEPGFLEKDMLWDKNSQETAEEHESRKHRLLEDIFANDPSTFIELTTHSYAISAILGAINMDGFRVSEGSTIALLVKAEKYLDAI